MVYFEISQLITNHFYFGYKKIFRVNKQSLGLVTCKLVILSKRVINKEKCSK